ncbi:aldehyde dehydrogenase family protein [Legionella israelensis]|uniref:Glycine betaine aldehyde dehydrogenase n=1 Tax=Legionella israelensis TaxID=454 RepID=A0A0W0VK35_9GAMM|nr:aldehyde dehydrogenase family protein [Legionella israelensis]KTD20468.1 glycine betaine aldehyde dehydrogenase [Legionella israelensis]QBS10853.1 aldehyde dehydrogenase family protein [Legionella israelensis]SCX86917.1 aldehyde dehydrogenase (acceptor) [Legionella israelensis DSM 19235]STX57831.1 glycine betaine aldehyde dehydrogenase [Legionella israelensis]
MDYSISTESLLKEHNITIRQTELLINGIFQPSVSEKTFDTLSPITGEVITSVALAEKEDVDKAVKAAREALENGPWSKMDARQRGKILLKWADLIEKHQEELAKLEVLDNGKPLNEAVGYDIPAAASTIRYFAGWADKIEGKTIPVSGNFFTYTQKEPVGVCGLIIPWNFPLAMAAWKLGPCLAAGCTALLKPAEQTPLTALRAGELALEAGLPAGVLNILPGFGGDSTGEAIVKHPGIDKLAFTGEARTAQLIKQATAHSMKRLSFELGGKSPNIIFDDVDIDEVVEGAIGAIFLNQGQNCCAGSRTFVQKNIYNDFVTKFAEKAKERRIGNPFKSTIEHGSQIDKAQFDRIMHYIQLGKEQGANCIAGGHRHGEKGYFIEPTVFSHVKDSMAIAQEEIFGPVASLLSFETMDEVIQRANNTSFGLAGAVWTNNIDIAYTIAQKVKAGTVWINCYNIVDPAAPFGGFKQSGTGRELGEQALDLYTETKTVTMLKRMI